MTVMLEVTQKVINSSKSGCECYFLKFGSRGIKVYTGPVTRDRAYTNQVWLHSKGLAPRAYFKGLVKITNRKGSRDCVWYCYETECAETFDYKRYYSDPDGYDDYRERFHTAVKELKEESDKLGVSWYDCHKGNVGFIDGRAVIIDTADRILRNIGKKLDKLGNLSYS